MKKNIIIILIILNICLILPTKALERKMILNNITIVIDPGHGAKDIGTSYQSICEKDINLDISKKLKKELEYYGANIILTREDDYDLSTPNANRRKKSDFDNRIKLINDINPDLVISIHQNYYKDPKYKGTQIFYKDNNDLAEYLQRNINKDRQAKKISKTLYMYNKINTEVLLIECGFLSNPTDRKNLTNEDYKNKYVKDLSKYIKEYFNQN